MTETKNLKKLKAATNPEIKIKLITLNNELFDGMNGERINQKRKKMRGKKGKESLDEKLKKCETILEDKKKELQDLKNNTPQLKTKKRKSTRDTLEKEITKKGKHMDELIKDETINLYKQFYATFRVNDNPAADPKTKKTKIPWWSMGDTEYQTAKSRFSFFDCVYCGQGYNFWKFHKKECGLNIKIENKSEIVS